MTPEQILGYVTFLEDRLETIHQRNDVALYADNLKAENETLSKSLKMLQDEYSGNAYRVKRFADEAEQATRRYEALIASLRATLLAMQKKNRRMEKENQRLKASASSPSNEIQSHILYPALELHLL